VLVSAWRHANRNPSRWRHADTNTPRRRDTHTDSFRHGHTHADPRHADGDPAGDDHRSASGWSNFRDDKRL